MTFLFILPNDILVSLYSEWLELKDIIRLDTAICNRQHRHQYLSSLRENQAILKGEMCLKNAPSLFRKKRRRKKKRKLEPGEKPYQYFDKEVLVNGIIIKWLKDRNVAVSHLDFGGKVIKLPRREEYDLMDEFSYMFRHHLYHLTVRNPFDNNEDDDIDDDGEAWLKLFPNMRRLSIFIDEPNELYHADHEVLSSSISKTLTNILASGGKQLIEINFAGNGYAVTLLHAGICTLGEEVPLLEKFTADFDWIVNIQSFFFECHFSNLKNVNILRPIFSDEEADAEYDHEEEFDPIDPMVFINQAKAKAKSHHLPNLINLYLADILASAMVSFLAPNIQYLRTISTTTGFEHARSKLYMKRDTQNLGIIWNNLNKLEHFRFSWNKIDQLDEDDQADEALANILNYDRLFTCSSRLKKIHLQGLCGDIIDRSRWVSLLAHLPRLECFIIKNYGYRPKLHEINFHESLCRINGATLGEIHLEDEEVNCDEFLKAMAENCSNLHTFTWKNPRREVSSCKPLTSASMLHLQFVTSLVNLTIYNYSTNTPQLTDIVLATIIPPLVNLRVLRCWEKDSNIGSKTYKAILDYHQRWRTVALPKCQNTVIMEAFQLRAKKECRYLRELDLMLTEAASGDYTDDYLIDDVIDS